MGPNDPKVAALRHNLGRFFLREERYADAGRELREALRVLELSQPSDHPSIAQALVNLGLVDLEDGNPAAALPRLERAVEIFEAAGASAARGEARYALAQCLWELGGDTERIAALVNGALDGSAEVQTELGGPGRRM